VFFQMTQQLLESPSSSWKPWFMWVNYVAPHQGGPMEPDDPQRLYPNDPSDWVPTTRPARADRGSFAGIQLPHSPSLFRSESTEPSDGPPMSPTRQAMVRYGYEQRIEALQSVDRAVARTVATLRRTGQLANTVLIFNSDNGFLTGEHNRYGKLVHFNDSERIPLLMAGPGIPKGVKVQTPVALPDLATTIAAIAHARPMRRQDGVNILPVLHERVQDRPIPVEAYPVHGGTQPIYTGIREGPWTYVHWHRHGGFEEMYDRQTDPAEMHNLALDPAYRAQLRHFRRLDRRYRDCAGATCPKTFVDPSRQPLLYDR
jgi:arylsulfatase A-like enzyme